MKILAIVQEKEDPVFVTTLTSTEFSTLGEFGVEQMVMEWCERKRYTYIDFGVE